jgi:hypothetical protein
LYGTRRAAAPTFAFCRDRRARTVIPVTRPALAPLVLVAILAAIPACGPAPEPAKEAPSPPPAADTGAAPTAEPTAAPEAPRPAASESSSPAETLARDLVKSGGRRIGFSATKKRFVVPIELRSDGGRGLDLRFYDDDGQQRENQRVCQPGECEEKLNELAKDLIPKLAARFEQEGYEAISSVGWPSGRDELDLSAANLKLKYDKGRLAVLAEKKAPVALRVGGGRAPRAAALLAVYPVPAAKLLGAFAPGGDNVAQDFYVFRLP